MALYQGRLAAGRPFDLWFVQFVLLVGLFVLLLRL